MKCTLIPAFISYVMKFNNKVRIFTVIFLRFTVCIISVPNLRLLRKTNIYRSKRLDSHIRKCLQIDRAHTPIIVVRLSPAKKHLNKK